MCSVLNMALVTDSLAENRASCITFPVAIIQISCCQKIFGFAWAESRAASLTSEFLSVNANNSNN
ncbi:hypothetical protein D3C72_1009850 [compost metagenome]